MNESYYSVHSTSADVSKLSTRAERFGTAAGKDEDDVKKKRAERFGMK